MRVAAAYIVLCLVAAPVLAQPPPSLVIEAPPELTSSRARLESYDLRPLADIVRLLGMDGPGPPMRVVLATTDSDWGRQVAPWVAGLAVGDAGLIVLFPFRSPAYPHDTLEDVLRHEVAHVLISRAALGRPVPRWFHEGLAMAVERPWGLQDRSRLVLELFFGQRLTLQGIDALFDGDQGMQSRGYTLAAAVVRDLTSEYGESAPARLLRGVAGGRSLDLALASVTTRSVSVFEDEFWNRHRTWTMWVPLVTSSTVFWLGVIGLAALAVKRRRRRAAAIRRRWAEEEIAEAAVEPVSNGTDAHGGDPR